MKKLLSSLLVAVLALLGLVSVVNAEESTPVTSGETTQPAEGQPVTPAQPSADEDEVGSEAGTETPDEKEEKNEEEQPADPKANEKDQEGSQSSGNEKQNGQEEGGSATPAPGTNNEGQNDPQNGSGQGGTSTPETGSQTTPVEKVTVTFDSNEGSTVEAKQVDKGQKVEKPADPTKEGFTFVGWFKEEALTNQFNFENEMVNEALTLYAKWEAKASDPMVEEKVTVTFEVNGGSAVDPLKVTKGQKVTKPETDPTKEGHTFGGWYSNAELTTVFNFEEVVNADVTVYAKWDVKETGNTGSTETPGKEGENTGSTETPGKEGENTGSTDNTNNGNQGGSTETPGKEGENKPEQPKEGEAGKTEENKDKASKKSNKAALIAVPVIAIVVLGAAGAAYVFIKRKK